MIESFEFKEFSNDNINNPFPKEIATNQNVIYHGTSSNYEKYIENIGILPNVSIFTLKELNSILDIFKHLNWSGITGASRSVLEPFSINYDFNNNEVKPVFFAETSYRASLYASYDFAGGEIARAVRKSFAELNQYVLDKKVQKEHIDLIKIDYDYIKSRGGKPHFEIPTPSIIELKQKLIKIESINQKAIQVQKERKYGIIYAIKFPPNQIFNLKYHKSMGFQSFDKIENNYLIGKTKVPKEWEHPILEDGLSRINAPSVKDRMHKFKK